MLAISGLLLFGSAGTASAASKPLQPSQPSQPSNRQTQGQAVQIVLDGQTLTWETAPVLKNGIVYADFRSLFGQLGYTVDYDSSTATIYARSTDHEIRMPVGGEVAIVDGKEVPMRGQAAVISGRTMIGVRFVAALSGKDAVWQPGSRTIRLTEAGPTDEQKQALFGLFDKLQLATAAQDAEGILALFSPDSPSKASYGEQLPNRLQSQIHVEITEKKIQSYSGKEAVVVTKEHTTGAGGDYYFDNTAVIEYDLRPDAGGEWRIYDVSPVSVEYDSPDALLDQAVAVPDADKAAIEALLQAQNDAYNAEDADAFRATVAPFDGLDDLVDRLKTNFAETDISYTLEKTAIVSYAQDRAVVVQQKLLQLKPQGLRMRILQGNRLVKRDGRWLFAQEEYLLKQEEPQDK